MTAEYRDPPDFAEGHPLDPEVGRDALAIDTQQGSNRRSARVAVLAVSEKVALCGHLVTLWLSDSVLGSVPGPEKAAICGNRIALSVGVVCNLCAGV